MTDSRCAVYEQAIDEGCSNAGVYPHARPTGVVLNAILQGLDAAGLLLTPSRLNDIAEMLGEPIDEDDLFRRLTSRDA